MGFRERFGRRFGVSGTNQHEQPQQPRRVQDLHAKQAAYHLRPQVGEGFGLAVAEEMVEGVMDGTRVVVGADPAIEVAQHAGALRLQVEVKLAATAELEEVQGNAPPSQEATLVDDRLLVAGIRQAVEPVVQFREEVADSLESLHNKVSGGFGL